MINFKNPEYETHKLTFDLSSDWIMVKHFKKYQENLNHLNYTLDFIIDQTDSILKEDCGFESYYWNSFKNHYYDNQLKDLVKDITDDLIHCEQCFLGTVNPRVIADPTLGKQDGIFAKMVNVLDSGVGNFLQNYTMATQIAKFECGFMDTFRNVIQVQELIKSGKIMYYFDKLYIEFKARSDEFLNYINMDDTDYCAIKIRTSDAYSNGVSSINSGFPFKRIIDKYKDDMKDGLKDLNDIIESLDGFFDEIYVGVKVLGALNIIFYAAPEDQKMLAAESESTFSAMTPPTGTDFTPQEHKILLQRRTLWAMATSVPIAIEASSLVNNARTNQASIFGSAVLATFQSIGFKDRLRNLNRVLVQQI